MHPIYQFKISVHVVILNSFSCCVLSIQDLSSPKSYSRRLEATRTIEQRKVLQCYKESSSTTRKRRDIYTQIKWTHTYNFKVDEQGFCFLTTSDKTIKEYIEYSLVINNMFRICHKIKLYYWSKSSLSFWRLFAVIDPGFCGCNRGFPSGLMKKGERLHSPTTYYYNWNMSFNGMPC